MTVASTPGSNGGGSGARVIRNGTGAPAIEVSHLWKKFRRGERHDSLRDLLPAAVKRLAGRAPAGSDLAADDFWALRDINFAVQPGEAVGIIGPNGAGKSTMLKLLTRILKPTRGSCVVRGRAGALIEVGAGFHPDLTGRENVFLQGAIMGMTNDEIARKMDAIVEFAGIRDAINTPVKRYSSGMNARLGFAIAAHIDPDVLIIDEVLAVGDMAFQEKCFARMHEFKRSGVAIVLVSHNLQAVVDLCDRAMFIQSEVRAEGPSADVVASYVRASGTATAAAAAGSKMRIVSADLRDEHGNATPTVEPGAPLSLTVTYDVLQPVDNYWFGFALFRSTDNLVVNDSNVDGGELGLPRLEPGRRYTVRFDFAAHLTRGQYHLDVSVGSREMGAHLCRLTPAGHLTVQEKRTYAGVADVELRWTLVGAAAAAGPTPSETPTALDPQGAANGTAALARAAAR